MAPIRRKHGEKTRQEENYRNQGRIKKETEKRKEKRTADPRDCDIEEQEGFFASSRLPVYRSLNQSAINWQAVRPGGRRARPPAVGSLSLIHRFRFLGDRGSLLPADIHFSPPRTTQRLVFPKTSSPACSSFPFRGTGIHSATRHYARKRRTSSRKCN